MLFYLKNYFYLKTYNKNFHNVSKLIYKLKTLLNLKKEEEEGNNQIREKEMPSLSIYIFFRPNAVREIFPYNDN